MTLNKVILFSLFLLLTSCGTQPSISPQQVVCQVSPNPSGYVLTCPGQPPVQLADGTPGLPGVTGYTGTQGVGGSQGIKGSTGQTGASGALGATGASGSNGFDGQVGATGNTGGVGLQGNTGATGERGIQAQICSNGSFACGDFLFSSNPQNGDYIGMNGISGSFPSTYAYPLPEGRGLIFVASNPNPLQGEVQIGATIDDSISNALAWIAVYVNSADTEASSPSTGTLQINLGVNYPGASGNSLLTLIVGSETTLMGRISLFNVDANDDCMGGISGAVGATGGTGAQGESGPTGAQGETGASGSTVSLTVIQFCPGYTESYPSVFPEFGWCLNSTLWAVYDGGANDVFLAEIVPGAYSSTSTSAACNFTVSANCQVTHE